MSSDLLKVGDVITIAGEPSRRGEPMAVVVGAIVMAVLLPVMQMNALVD